MFTIHNMESFEKLLFSLKQTALTWSNTARDVKGIDMLFNGDVDKRVTKNVHHRLYMPYCLIAARLANNPNFEKLAVSLGTYGAGSGRVWGKFSYVKVAEAWPKLVQYLRDEVKPLV